MDSVYLTKDNCCGCTACMCVCPKNAIMMVADNKGFYYPKIDSEKCVNCGLCRRVCQFGEKEISEKYNEVRCFALKHKDFSVIKASRSAGAFTAFSDYILSNGGVVYGVVLNSDFSVNHQRAVTIEQRNRFRESKYVQSNLEGVFNSVASDLSANKIVMFSGTGCQCDGLRSFLQTKRLDTHNLLIVDIVCHGVPSPKMFVEYIKWNEQKNKSVVTDFKFRDKDKYTWGEGIEKLTFSDGKIKYQDYFTEFIFSNFIRECCYNCKYTTPYRNSDITLADFWGSEKKCPEYTDYKNGCSLVMIHSEKAMILFNKIQNSVSFKNVGVEDCMQPRLETPRKKNSNADFYWEEYCNKGFDYVMKKYATNSLSMSVRIKTFIERIIKFPYKILRNKKNAHRK